MWARFLPLLALGFAVSPAAAHDDPTTCRYEHDIAPILRYYRPEDAHWYIGGAILICVDRTGSAAGRLYSAPRKNALGICSVGMRDVSLKRSWHGGLYRPLHDPVDRDIADIVLQQPAAGDCPPSDDSGYVFVRNIPDGVFLEFYRLWKTMQKTPAALNAIAPGIPASDGSLVGLQKDLSDPATAPHFSLMALNAAASYATGTSVYVMEIRDDRDYTQWYSLDFDWADGKFVLLHVALSVT